MAKQSIYIPDELVEAYRAWEKTTGETISLSAEVQAVIRRRIGQATKSDALEDRVKALEAKERASAAAHRALMKRVRALELAK